MTLWVTLCTSQQPVKATVRAMIGEISEGSRILPTTPSSLVPSPFHFTPAQPRPAAPAPVRPPSRACDELDGRPSSQVNRFHRMPPARPARMMSSTASPPSASSSGFGAPSLVCRLITALVTVSATCTERKAPTRFRIADSPTATLGFRAPVEIDAAMALAVSWKPFVKSKASAVTMTSTRVMFAASTSHQCGGDNSTSPR